MLLLPKIWFWLLFPVMLFYESKFFNVLLSFVLNWLELRSWLVYLDFENLSVYVFIRSFKWLEFSLLLSNLVLDEWFSLFVIESFLLLSCPVSVIILITGSFYSVYLIPLKDDELKSFTALKLQIFLYTSLIKCSFRFTLDWLAETSMSVSCWFLFYSWEHFSFYLVSWVYNYLMRRVRDSKVLSFDKFWVLKES